MFLYEAPERRRAMNRPIALLVDAGLICRFSLGNDAAKLLYRTYNVPSTVAARVLYHESQRRRTELELAMSERGQTVNLTRMADSGDDD